MFAHVVGVGGGAFADGVDVAAGGGAFADGVDVAAGGAATNEVELIAGAAWSMVLIPAETRRVASR